MNIARKIPVPTTAPDATAQGSATRLRRLEALKAGDHEAAVRSSLATAWARRHPAFIRLRPQFVRLDRPVRGPVSDGKIRDLPRRPALAKLVSPRGIALRTYLVAVFYAQSTAKRGSEPRNEVPIEPLEVGSVSWSDLIAAHSASNPGNRRRLTGVRENRVRQIKSALGTLASDELRLVELPMADHATGRYERFRLLHESGSPRHAAPIRYTVPKKTDTTFSVPAAFFLQGWVHVLEDREIAAYLVLCQRGASSNPVSLEAEERVRRYGLARTTQESFATLERFGLVETMVDPNRREDGTFEGYSDGRILVPNEYRLTDGVDELAIDVVSLVLSG